MPSLTSSMKRGLSTLIVGGMAVLPAAAVHAQAPLPSASTLRVLLDTYCVTCHNQRAPQSGLMFDRMDVSNVAVGADVWEKVVRRLRAGSMPPEGRPRPDKTTYAAVASLLETALDRAAAATPNPGRVPSVHRLSRTEYKNAIRDVLGIESLPKGMDITLLLPADNSSSGFDNLAHLLFVSPTVLDGYLSAARKISGLAVGDAETPLTVDAYRLPSELPQDTQLDGLPPGTRGGASIRTHLPLDGEYALEIDVSGTSADAHQLEVAVDGSRVRLFTVGARGTGQEPTEMRLPLKAGERVITVAFVQPSAALGEEMLARTSRRGASGLTTGMLVQKVPVVGAVTISGPYNGAGPGDTRSRRRLFICQPTAPAEEAPCAARILSALARRAYRRPVTTADFEWLLPFYEEGRTAGGFDAGIRYAIERVLVSPQFLFRIERTPPSAAPDVPVQVTDVELASRLSFFLWSSIPDEPLLDLAASGKLHDPATLERQVRRMLADPRSESLVGNFVSQWLFLRDLDAKRPDLGLFPEFDEGLRQAFRRETELFSSSILRENRSALDLLRANYTFVNERLARHYGIPNVYGSHFRRVTLGPDSARGGLLGQGSILLLTSYPTRTSPVLRGKWILDNLLGAPPPPPPPNVPNLREKNTDGTPLSMREAMVQHRANPVCASCHLRMDPVGFAFENFDALGRWRTRGESGAPIDATSILADGSKLDGLPGIRRFLLSQREAFIANLTEKLLTYALGRNVDYFDMPVVRKIVREAAPSDYTFSSLILGVTRSLPFRMRRSDASSAGTMAAQ